MEDARRQDSMEATAAFGQPVSGIGTVRLEKAAGVATKAVLCQLDISRIMIETDVFGNIPR
jgi:hypothetical protein